MKYIVWSKTDGTAAKIKASQKLVLILFLKAR